MITKEILNNFEVLRDQPTKENPFIVDSYPYGFKRTKARYYVDTTKRGDRLVFQTLNPMTQKWNKEKKSTYSPVLIYGIHKKSGHFKVIMSLNHYSKEEFENKYNLIKDLVNFNEFQKEKIKDLIAFHKVMDKVSFECVARKFRNKITGEITESIPIFEMSNYEEVGNEEGQKDKEQKENWALINYSINQERNKL